MNQTKPRCLTSRAQSKQTRNLFVSSETNRATAAVRSCGASSPSCACLLPWFPVSTGSWTPHCKASGGRWWLRSHSRQKNAREIPIPPVFFLAFSPRLCPQPNARCLCSCTACSSQSSYPHRLRTNPSPSPTHQRGKKALFFSSEKGEREKIILLSSVQSSRGHQGTEAGRRTG